MLRFVGMGRDMSWSVMMETETQVMAALKTVRLNLIFNAVEEAPQVLIRVSRLLALNV